MFLRTIKTQPQTNPGRRRWVRLSERPQRVKGSRAEMRLPATCAVGWVPTHLCPGRKAARSPGRGMADRQAWTPLYLSISEKPGDVALPSPNRQPVGAAPLSAIAPQSPAGQRAIARRASPLTPRGLHRATRSQRVPAGRVPSRRVGPPNRATKKPRPRLAAGVLSLTRPGPPPDQRHPIKDRWSRRSCCLPQASHTPS